LAFLLEGEVGSILEVRGRKKMVQKLSDLGMVPSTKIKVIKSNPPGPMLVEVRKTRIALGRGFAMKIMVSNGERL